MRTPRTGHTRVWSAALPRLAVATVVVFAWSVAPAAAHHVGDLDCADFSTQAAAQYHMNAHPGDPDGLDGSDDDGLACELNPCPCYHGSDTGPPPPPPAD